MANQKAVGKNISMGPETLKLLAMLVRKMTKRHGVVTASFVVREGLNALAEKMGI